MPYAQNNEEELLTEVFDAIGVTNKTAVEFGAKDGLRLSNTAHFRLNHGWNCVLLDVMPGAPNVIKAQIRADNVNDVLRGAGVPESFDLISIDIDGNDLWVWKALELRPRVVVIEYNSLGGSRTTQYDPDVRWDGSAYFGAGAEALQKLAHEKGYTLAASTSGPSTNLIFVLAELWTKPEASLPGPGWPGWVDGAGKWHFVPPDSKNRAWEEY